MPVLQKIMRSAVPLVVLLGVVSGSLLAQDNEPAGESQQLFTEQVGPLLVSRCGKCHGSTEQKAELDLTSRAGIEKGGESGPLLVAGKPGESRLLEMVVRGEMPRRGRSLSPARRSSCCAAGF